MTKKILSLALVIVLLIGLLPVEALADMLDLGSSDMTVSNVAATDNAFTVYYTSKTGLIFPVSYSGGMYVGGGSSFNAVAMNSFSGDDCTFDFSPSSAGYVDAYGTVYVSSGVADNTVLNVTVSDHVNNKVVTRTFTVLNEGNGGRFQGGYGTAERPYLISNATHFNNIRTALSSHYLLTGNISLGTMDPLGNFSGVLDGNNYTVSGWRYTMTTNGTFGMFNAINSGASVKNIVLYDCQLTGADGPYGQLVAGVLCGTNSGAVENVRVLSCKVTGDMGDYDHQDNDSHTLLGGMCGINYAAIRCSGVVSTHVYGYAGSHAKKGTANCWVGGVAAVGRSTASFVDVYSHGNRIYGTAEGHPRNFLVTGACGWYNAGGVVGRTDGDSVSLTRVLGYQNDLTGYTCRGENSEANLGSIIGYMYNNKVYLSSCYSESSDTMFGRGDAGSATNIGCVSSLTASGIVNSLIGFPSNNWVAGTDGHLEQAQYNKLTVDTSAACEYYRAGQPLDLANLKFTQVDNVGRTSSVTSGYTISGYDPSWPTDTQTVTVTYRTYSAKFTCKKLPSYTVTIYCTTPNAGILHTETHSVEYMEAYDIPVPDIPGYATTATEITGVMDTHGNEAIDISYYPKDYTYTVKYVLADDESVELSPSITGTRTFGEELYFESPTILGYRLVNNGSTPGLDDSIVTVPGDYAGDYTHIVRYANAEDRFYTIRTILGFSNLSGVEVTFNGTTKLTDSLGCAVFYYPEGLEEAIVSANKEGYVSGKFADGYSIFVDPELPIDYVEMKIEIADNPLYSLDGISCYGEDLSKGMGVVNAAYDEEIEIIVKGSVPADDKINYIQIVQDVDEVDPATGASTGRKIKKVLQTKYASDFSEKDGSCTFMIKGTQFEYRLDGSNKIYAYMYTRFGAEPYVEELWINTVKFGTEFVFEGLFDKVEVNLNDTGLPFLDNTKLSMEMNDKYKFENPFSFEFKNNEIYVSYNLGDEFNYYVSQMAPGIRRAGYTAQNRTQSFLRHMTEKADKKLEDNKLLHRKGTADVKIETDAAGGMCFVVNGDGTISSYSYFKISLVMQASWTTDYVIVFLPVTVTATVGLEGEVMITGLAIDFAHMDIIWPSVEVSLTLKMGLSAGLGCRFASVGVFARLSIGCTLHIGEEVYFDALILNGEAGFYAKLDLGLFTLYGEKSWKFLDKTIHLTPAGTAVSTSEMTQSEGVYYVGQYNGLPIYDIDNYELTLANSGIEPEIDWEVPDATFLSNEVSERAGGKIYTVLDKQVAIYFTEASDRHPADAKILTYQVYSCGEWSEPMYINDNGTSDTSFDAIVYDGQLYVVYAECSVRLGNRNYQDDSLMILDSARWQNIAVVKFDYYDDSFYSMKSAFSSISFCASMPTFGVADDCLYIAWNKNTAQDDSMVFGENMCNSVWYSKLDGTSWTQPVCLIQNCYPILDMAVLKLNGRMSVALIVDEDVNLLSTYDRNIYLIRDNGDRTQINCYGTQIGQLEAHAINGTPTLLWKSDDAVMAYAGAVKGAYQLSGENLSIPGEYRFIHNNSVYGLFWTASPEDDQANVYCSFSKYCADWSNPMVAMTAPYYVTDFDVSMIGVQYHILFTDTFVQSGQTEGEQDLRSFSKQCHYKSSVPKTLTVVSHEVQSSGSDFTLTVTVRNDGATAIDYVDLKLTEISASDDASAIVSDTEKEIIKDKFTYVFSEIYISANPGETCTIAKTYSLYEGSTLADYDLTVTIAETTGDSSVSGGITGPNEWGDGVDKPIYPEEIIPDDYVSTDKVVIYETMRPDFAIAGEYVILGETEYLSVNVVNIGDIAGSGYLKIYRPEIDSDGKEIRHLVHSEYIETLQVNHQKFYLIKLEKDFFALTRQEFICELECVEDTKTDNNCVRFLAYKLEGAEGTQEDVLVDAPVLDSYTQDFDKYSPQDAVVNVTLNEDILGYYGCVDADRNNVDHTVLELEGDILQLTFSKNALVQRDVAHHEFTLYFKTAAGYIQTVFLMKIADSTPIPLTGEIILMDAETEAPVTGNLQRGMTLFVNVSSVNTQSLQYHWWVDGVEVSTESAYKIEQADLGKTLQVSVIGASPYVGTVYSNEFSIDKVERDVFSPVVKEVDENGTVTLENVFQVGDDKTVYGYSTVDDPATVTQWSTTPEFSITESGTYYLFAAMLSSNIYRASYSDGTYYAYEAPCKHPVYVDGVCQDCGEKDPNYVEIALKYPTLLLEDEIKLNVYFTVDPDMDTERLGMLVWSCQPDVVDINTAERVFSGSVYHQESGFYSVASAGIPAQYLGDSMYFCIYAQRTDGSYVYSKQVSYSPADFAYGQLGKATVSDVAKSLYVSILNYGAEAQIYTGYRTDALINRNLTQTMLAYLVEYREDMVHGYDKPSAQKQGELSKTAAGFSKRNPTISLDSAFAINYYFTPDRTPAGQMQFYYWTEADYLAADALSTDNATGQMVMTQTADGYRATLTGIPAKDIDAPYYVCGVYFDEEGNAYSTGILPYSIGTFCKNQVSSGSEMCRPLAAAIAVYGYCAATYFSTI